MIMSMTEKKMRTEELHRPLAGTQLRPQTTCTRCGGLMVQEICTDLSNSTTDLECATRRCVQCGDIIDAMILRNRYRRAESMTVRNH
ncbi:MAG: hypothetical protein OEU68_18415 [Nitrospira sp.]|jgi:hypothetical protein|nr:hypothetical protein [Nitrospira sp.]MDH5318934.1 hypothetical protein [Nitrospira sp.]